MACCSKKTRDMIMQGVNKAAGNHEAMLAKLGQVEYLALDAKVDWIECMQLCETQNFYSMYATGNNFIIPFGSQPMITFQEHSDCCCRFFVRHCREFTGDLKIDGFTVANCQTKYKCHSCNPFCSCPCSFPELIVTQAGQFIGMIRIPYYVFGCGQKGHPCSIMEMDILDTNGNIIYRLSGNCCQTSVWCLPFMCCGCETINYDIREPGTIGVPLAPGQNRSDFAVGSIKNVCRDCPEECFTKADRFGITFPPNADLRKRLLIIMAAIYLDYAMYEAFP